MFATMSEDQISELEEQLKNLQSLAGLMKVVVGGAIAIGIWVGAIQFQVAAATKTGDENKDRVRTLEIKGATVDQKLENIYEVVRRIDNKIHP